MRAGPLRHRIVISSQGSGQDAAGQPDGSWSTDATVWGSVEPISGGEVIDAGQVQHNTTHRVRMRYNPDNTITTKNRLTHDSRTFEIIHVTNKNELNHELEIMCVEVT